MTNIAYNTSNMYPNAAYNPYMQQMNAAHAQQNMPQPQYQTVPYQLSNYFYQNINPAIVQNNGAHSL